MQALSISKPIEGLAAPDRLWLWNKSSLATASEGVRALPTSDSTTGRLVEYHFQELFCSIADDISDSMGDSQRLGWVSSTDRRRSVK